MRNFIYVLSDIVHWSSLSLINKDDNSFHWKTIYNEFNKWTKDNIFEDAFYTFIKEKYFKISQIKKSTWIRCNII